MHEMPLLLRVQGRMSEAPVRPERPRRGEEFPVSGIEGLLQVHAALFREDAGPLDNEESSGQGHAVGS